MSRLSDLYKAIETLRNVLTHSSSMDKKKMLDRINKALNMGWTVEIVKWKMRMDKQDIEPHHGKHKEGGPAGGHGRMGDGDRQAGVWTVWAERGGNKGCGRKAKKKKTLLEYDETN